MEPARIAYLNEVYFGFGAVAVLDRLLAQFKVRRPMLVVDPQLARTALADRLPMDPVSRFDEIFPNPTEASAHAAAALFGDSGADGFVALGGGSCLDLAKAAALLIHHRPPLAQYAFIHGGAARITANRPPLIAIPTTAGTGSEVGRAALITLSGGDKLALLGQPLIPDAAICDPDLTATMPATLTAATGMDAISHCIETFCSPMDNPVADAIALDGLARGFAHLQAVCRDPSHRQGRRQMMMAALEGGLTFQKGLGAIHALSHPLGALEHKSLHHGTLNAIFLPHVLRFNAEACPKKMAQIAARVCIADPGDLPQHFATFSAQLALPASLSELGLQRSDLDPLVAKALADHCAQTNPRPLDAGDCRALYEAAWSSPPN